MGSSDSYSEASDHYHCGSQPMFDRSFKFDVPNSAQSNHII